jgi:vacuolar-type H+-ATPase subunit E/Vma4
MLSFNNITTSQAEEEHARLKRVLKTSTRDLKKMINVIELILKNESAEYLTTHQKIISRLLINYRIIALQKLQNFINSLTLRFIRKQLNKLIRLKKDEDLSSCIKIYELLIRLSCAHLLELRSINDKSMIIENVHSY